jgi:hypothetical protein
VSHEVAGLRVSAAEYPKVRYALFALKCANNAYQDFKNWRNAVALSEGVSVDAKIDWRLVANHCAPQVLFLMVKDNHGEIMEHPAWAILTESHQVIPLTTEVILSAEEEPAKTGVDALSALNSLHAYVEAMTGGKKENAVKQLQILRRILR